MKTWTRQELTDLTMEQYNALSPEQQLEVRTQGRAYRNEAFGEPLE
jgi:hypothetical protein